MSWELFIQEKQSNITTKPNLFDENSRNVYLWRLKTVNFVLINALPDYFKKKKKRHFIGTSYASVKIQNSAFKLLGKKNPKNLHEDHK